MTTPDSQARTLRTAIERQQASQEAAREAAREIARERAPEAPVVPETPAE